MRALWLVDGERLAPWLLCGAFALAGFGCGEPGPDPEGVGAPCESTCADGLSCVIAPGYVDGYCSATCEDGVCPTGAVCAPDIAPPLCLAGCSSRAQCRDGYQCWRGGCRPACASEPDCGGATCNGGQCEGCATAADCPPTMACVDRMCVAGADGGGVLFFGAPCERDGECVSNLCLPAAAGGVCGAECSSANDCFGLAGEAACSAIDDGAGGVRTACTPFLSDGAAMAEACVVDTDCQTRTCQQGQCTEACTMDGDCAIEPMICATLVRGGGSFRGCGYADRTGEVDVLDLGSATLPGGASQTHTIAVPPDAVSLTLEVLRTGGDPLDVTFGHVSDPADESLYDLASIAELTDTPVRWLPLDTGEVAAMLVPNTTPDRVPFRRGRYEFSTGLFAAEGGGPGEATLATRVLIKRAEDGLATSGTLDLNVFLVDVGLTAAAAPTDARLSTALSRLDSILSSASIRLGDIAYHDVTGADATRYSIIESTEGESSELAGLFRLSEGQVGARLNIFLVRQIDGSGEGFAALGIAGGIPGPVDRHGTQHSGVVAAFDPSVVGGGASGAAVVGHILAHEIGHFLGLYHSTERLPPCAPGDPPGSGCSAFGGGDVLVDTSRGDSRNLMFWSIVGSGDNDRMSNGQGFVMRASAMVRP